jgi:hypothetical protein
MAVEDALYLALRDSDGGFVILFLLILLFGFLAWCPRLP